MKTKSLLMILVIMVVGFSSCDLIENGEDNGGTNNIVNSDITTNTTWESGKTYVISGSVSVDGATLTIEPGAVIKFEAGASLHIGYYSNATLIANGTSSKPITFTSTASSPAPGAWEGITFWDNSLNSSMQYCKVQYAGKATEGAVNVKGCEITFSNNEVTNAKLYGVMLNYEGYFTAMSGNSFANCGSHPVRISAKYMHTIGTGNTFTCPADKGINVYSGDATGNITWRKLDKPYYIEGEIDFDNGTLTIEPGTVLKFDADGSLHIGYYNNSTLIANGTSDNKIEFTSSAAVPAAGAWKGITFWNNSLNSSMKYCNILYAGTSTEGAVNVKNCAITFENNTINYAKSYGSLVNYEGSFTSMINNAYSNCGNHPLRISSKYMHTIGTGNTFNCPEGKGVNVYAEDVTGNITWRKLDKPYYIEGDIDFDNGTLTIEAGTILKFNADGSLHIGYYNNSTLIAVGNSSNYIVFTTDASSPAAGAWVGIHLWDNNSANTNFNYCKFMYAGKGSSSDNTRAALKASSTSFSASNCEFSYSAGWGIYLSNSTYTGTGNTFNNCALGNQGSN